MNQTQKDRSCRICGFFCDNRTEVNLGYCLAVDEEENRKAKGECLKIPDDETHGDIAQKCPNYFRRVPSLQPGEFLNWRMGIMIWGQQRKLDKYAKCLTIFALFIAACQIYIALK